MNDEKPREFWIAPDDICEETGTFLGCAIHYNTDTIPKEFLKCASAFIDRVSYDKLAAKLERVTAERDQLLSKIIQITLEAGEIIKERDALKAWAGEMEKALGESDKYLDELSSGRIMGTDYTLAGENAKRYSHQIQVEIRVALAKKPEGL